VVMHAGLGIAGAQGCGIADSGDFRAVQGDCTLGQDARGIGPFDERIATEAEDLAKDQIGHLAPVEPAYPRVFRGTGKFSTDVQGLKLFRKSAKARIWATGFADAGKAA
jgi:hypothetical protein